MGPLGPDGPRDSGPAPRFRAGPDRYRSAAMVPDRPRLSLFGPDPREPGAGIGVGIAAAGFSPGPGVGFPGHLTLEGPLVESRLCCRDWVSGDGFPVVPSRFLVSGRESGPCHCSGIKAED